MGWMGCGHGRTAGQLAHCSAPVRSNIRVVWPPSPQSCVAAPQRPSCVRGGIIIGCWPRRWRLYKGVSPLHRGPGGYAANLLALALFPPLMGRNSNLHPLPATSPGPSLPPHRLVRSIPCECCGRARDGGGGQQGAGTPRPPGGGQHLLGRSRAHARHGGVGGGVEEVRLMATANLTGGKRMVTAGTACPCDTSRAVDRDPRWQPGKDRMIDGPCPACGVLGGPIIITTVLAGPDFGQGVAKPGGSAPLDLTTLAH